MKNRAKCRLCNDTLESFHATDRVECKCGEISISGGAYKFEAAAKSWKNFLRLDDDDNEIEVKVIDEDVEEAAEPHNPLTKEAKLDMLKGMIDSYERLPQHALQSFCTNADLASALMLIYELVKD